MHKQLTNILTNTKEVNNMESLTIISKADRKIRGYRLKSLHMNYIEGYITDFDYREVLWFTINRIRRSINLPELSESEFDKAWQVRTMEHETWEIARSEILSTISE